MMSKSPPRAWIKKEGLIKEVDGLNWIRSKLWTVETTDNRSYVPGKQALLLQPTGRKDEKGQEIYEGDVVSWTQSAEWDEAIPSVRTGVVEWSVDGFIVREIETSDYDYLGQYVIEEILGNKYENAELLKEK